jgi:hypothetical protein
MLAPFQVEGRTMSKVIPCKSKWCDKMDVCQTALNLRISLVQPGLKLA